MPASAWTYSDWITYQSGTATRVSRLRLHIHEVSDALKRGSYTVEGRSWSAAELQRYLEGLYEKETVEAASTAAATSRAYFTRGRAL